MTPNAVALVELLIRERSALSRFLGRYLDSASTEDTLQEMYLRARSVPGDPPIIDRLGYLYRMAYRQVLDHGRALRRRQAMLDRIGRMPDESRIGDVAVTAQAQLELRRAIQAVMALPQPTRRIFALRIHDGLTEREIAARLRISRTTVTKHIQRAMTLVGKARDGR
ncbi:MAG: RNA polymerase sigma factor [Pseudoxanthomonas sp.]